MSNVSNFSNFNVKLKKRMNALNVHRPNVLYTCIVAFSFSCN